MWTKYWTNLHCKCLNKYFYAPSLSFSLFLSLSFCCPFPTPLSAVQFAKGQSLNQQSEQQRQRRLTELDGKRGRERERERSRKRNKLETTVLDSDATLTGAPYWPPSATKGLSSALLPFLSFSSFSFFFLFLLSLLFVNWYAVTLNWNSTFWKLHFIFKTLAPSVGSLYLTFQRVYSVV